MCNKALNTSSFSAIEFVPECYKTQDMFINVADTCLFVFSSVFY